MTEINKKYYVNVQTCMDKLKLKKPKRKFKPTIIVNCGEWLPIVVW